MSSPWTRERIATLIRPWNVNRLAGAVVLGLATGLLAHAVRAHDSWINHMGFTDPETAVHCCGEKDCAVLSVDDIEDVAGGYRILATGEFIPKARALPSLDGRFHRCRTSAADLRSPTRCLFVPHNV